MKIKVFESGKYPQGIFDMNKVKKIFGDIKDKVEGIFVHSSKWKKENKEPLNIGEFNNFELKEKDGKVEVFADVNFNDTGQNYYNDGILKGVSVEITSEDKLDKIAVLPVGTTPAVVGAEFEQSDVAIFNFEEVKELDREEVLKSITLDELKTVSIDGYDIEIKEKSEPKIKTEEEIREEVKKEFEKKAEVKNEVSEFMKENSKKITPAMGKILTNDNLEVIFSVEDTLEFESKSLDIKKFIKDFFVSIPDLIKTEKTEIEFEKEAKSENKIASVMEEARKQTEERYKK